MVKRSSLISILLLSMVLLAVGSASASNEPATPWHQIVNPNGAFRDGRINQDPGQKAAVYCRNNGIDIFYRSGKTHFFIPQEVIDAAGYSDTEPTMVSSNSSVVLWRLPGGWFQVDVTVTARNKPTMIYGVRFNACPPSVVEPFSWYPYGTEVP